MECLVVKKNSEKEILVLSSDIFDVKYNEILLHQLIVSYLGNSHQRTKMQKSRGMVRGGGKKPWKQKGSGRARVGSIRSPLWRGGGKIFAANGLSVLKRKINKKVYRLGMMIIFSELFRSNRINIIEDLVVSDMKTKLFLNEIKYLNVVEPALFVFKTVDLCIHLSTRNLKNIVVISCEKLNPAILLKFKFIFITVSAIKFIEEYLK